MRLAHKCPKCGGYDVMAIPPLSAEETVYHMVLLRRYGCNGCNWPFREFAGKLHVVKRRVAERVRPLPQPPPAN